MSFNGNNRFLKQFKNANELFQELILNKGKANQNYNKEHVKYLKICSINHTITLTVA